VVDDGSTDDPSVPDDPRVRLLRTEDNRGLGAALNTALDATTAPVVAYLPADDAWDADHLSSLLGLLDGDRAPTWRGAACGGPAGRRRDAPGDHGLQLVQVAHRRTGPAVARARRSSRPTTSTCSCGGTSPTPARPAR
jgi:glycosyltransferase involved in cell wall biosynthesis